MPPQTLFAKSGDLHIAYQIVGDGPLDIIYVPGWVSHVELGWDEPLSAKFLNRLASMGRLIQFDKRGTGMSDRVPNDRLPTLEERVDDLHVVMAAAGSERAAIVGVSEGGNLAATFAAMCPDMATHLVMINTFAKRKRSEDYPWAPSDEEREAEYVAVAQHWGQIRDVAHYAPSRALDPAFAERLATFARRSASPGAAVALLRMNTEIDISGLLPTIQAPTLVMNRTGDRDVNVEEGRWLAERIPGARFVELPGDDHVPWIGDQDRLLDEIQEFLTGDRAAHDGSRVLATILFTDIVDSTARAGELGDAAWRELLDEHDRIIAEVVRRWRGELIKSTGDGALATFDGPGRAISCARDLVVGMRTIGLQIRSGLHTGEIEIRGPETSGVAVHLAARIAALADGDEILVSRTVRDLVAGSRVTFTDRGVHTLKGFAEPWPIYAVG